jgi:hypothetical protein
MNIFKKIATIFGGKARQINLDGLKSTLQELIEKKMDYDFFGITSNGIDCVYFVDVKGEIDIEFEVMGKDQLPYVEKLKKFAFNHGFRIVEKTYGNKSLNDDSKNAPVYKIETNADISKAAQLGTEIMTTIFSCDESTKFDVVP